MSKLKFNNRENECIIHEGKEYWISRSVAVVAIIIGHLGNKTFVLSGKRSKKMDNPGKQSLVCGYIDWDETGYDAIRREIFEESSLDINKAKKYLIFNNNKQPYFVKTDPSENRQNITLNYIFEYDFSDNIEFMNKLEEYTCDEVDSVKWINLINIESENWAFDHNKRIKNVIDFLNERHW